MIGGSINAMSATQPFTKRNIVATLPLFFYAAALAGLLSSCGIDAGPSHSKQVAIAKLNAVVQKANEASRFGGPWRDANDRVPDSVLQQMKDYNEAILKDSREIDFEALNGAYPNLGTMFQDTLVKSMSLSVEVANAWMDMRKSNGKLIMTPELQKKVDDSKRLETEWASWFNAHFDDINKALQ